jgi:hypothetical protein
MAAARCRDCGGSEWTEKGRCRSCHAFSTLGYQVIEWIESRCAIPDREEVGNPLVLVDEQIRFILHFYRLKPLAKPGQLRQAFHHSRGGALVRPQKWGKSPFSAAIVCAEAQGPVVFDGWDADGQPVGTAWPTPIIQITAVSEDQTENIYKALIPMIELGALSAEIDDTGLGRINLAGGGQIKPVTASAISRLGQRITFAAQDQTESWLKRNKGRELADVQRRGLGGTGGRFLETPNAWDPTENSVAQGTLAEAEEGLGVYHDDVEPAEGLSIRNKTERRRALRTVYGDAATGTRAGVKGAVKPWSNLDSIDEEIRAILLRDPAQAERWYLTRKQAAEAKAFRGDIFDKRSRRVLKPEDPLEPKAGELVVVGIDGARFVDGLGMIGTEVGQGFQWTAGIWERPESAPDDYEHPFDEIDGALVDIFERFQVWRAYIDPQFIEDWVDTWQGRWGEKRIVRWLTNRPKPIAYAVRGYEEAIAAGDQEHDGHPDFARHIKNAVRRPLNVFDEKHRQMHTLAKESEDSPNKMDGAMAATLSWEARGDAIAAGAKKRSNKLITF